MKAQISIEAVVNGKVVRYRDSIVATDEPEGQELLAAAIAAIQAEFWPKPERTASKAASAPKPPQHDTIANSTTGGAK